MRSSRAKETSSVFSARSTFSGISSVIWRVAIATSSPIVHGFCNQRMRCLFSPVRRGATQRLAARHEADSRANVLAISDDAMRGPPHRLVGQLFAQAATRLRFGLAYQRSFPLRRFVVAYRIGRPKLKHAGAPPRWADDREICVRSCHLSVYTSQTTPDPPSDCWRDGSRCAVSPHSDVVG